MSNWIKENKKSFLVASLGGAAFLGITVWGILQGKEESAIYADITSKSDYIAQIASSAKPGVDEVLRQMKSAQADIAERRALLEKEFLPYYANCNLESLAITPEALLSEVKAVNNELIALAKEKKLTLSKSVPWAGMMKYGMDLAAEANAPYLNFELQGIRNIVQIIMNSGATSISKLYRVPLAMEVAATAEKKPIAPRNPAVVARIKPKTENIVMPFEVSFTGERGMVAKVLHAITSDKSYYYNITAMRVKNTLEVLPVLKATPLVAPKDELSDSLSAPTTAGAAPAAPEVTEVLKPLVGHEKLTVFLSIDLYYFAPPVAAPNQKTRKP